MAARTSPPEEFSSNVSETLDFVGQGLLSKLKSVSEGSVKKRFVNAASRSASSAVIFSDRAADTLTGEMLEAEIQPH